MRAAAAAWLCALPLLGAVPALADGGLQSAYVVLGDGGAIQARAIVDGPACPDIRIDGRRRPMGVRAAPAALSQRPTASAPQNAKPSDFPVLTCEARVPGMARRAEIAGRRLPLPPGRIDRIVVIGDTGCRIKIADKAFQACNDPRQWPFAAIAARAAAWKPDVVLHVGDYLYRENACPADQAGCQGSPWGYGWDAWRADFFDPAAPLLKAAPWILVRGNHENCARAGQGWWRMLEAAPLRPGRDCNEAKDDVVGDYAPPYAVPLGGRSRVVVLDLAIAPGKVMKPGDPRAAQFDDAYAHLAHWSALGGFTFMATHKPILGFAAEQHEGAVQLRPGTESIQAVFGAGGRPLLPQGVDVLLAGHVHLWQQVGFSSDHPSQLIAGFSGTQEDIVPMPARLPAGAVPAPGAIPDAFSSWIDGFGWMTLERAGPDRWRVQVRNVSGEIVNRCEIRGRRSHCERDQVPPAAK